jgi:hypothetical protein
MAVPEITGGRDNRDHDRAGLALNGSAWINGANGLYRLCDRMARRNRLKQVAADRIAAISERFDLVMTRNGWRKRENSRRWYREAA